jgi:multidrug efflux pump subunit AcrA (membrane-fusion protein)
VYLKYPTVVYAASESTAYASLSDVVRSISVKVGDTVRQDEVIVAFSPDNQSLRQATVAHESTFAAFNLLFYTGGCVATILKLIKKASGAFVSRP